MMMDETQDHRHFVLTFKTATIKIHLQLSSNCSCLHSILYIPSLHAGIVKQVLGLSINKTKASFKSDELTTFHKGKNPSMFG